MVITNFRIIHLDTKKLICHRDVTFNSNENQGYLLDDGTYFTYLKIIDNNLFGTLSAGTHRTLSVKRDYSRMDITIGNFKTGNLQNMTVTDYKRYVKRIFSYLYEEYGLLIDDTYVTTSSLEINCTFEIRKCFSEYHRVLRLLMFLLPDYYKKIVEVNRKDKFSHSLEAETFYRGNNSMQIKIYDKSQQLSDVYGYSYGGNLMRIEFVLKTSQKIKEVFGSTNLCALSDIKVIDFFIRQFRKLFKNKYQNWKKLNGKTLRQLILDHKKLNPTYWQRNLLNELRNSEQITHIPQLLEVQDLLTQIKILETAGHYKRTENSILKLCRVNDIYLQNDAQKINEIISKVENIYQNQATALTASRPTTSSGDIEMRH